MKEKDLNKEAMELRRKIAKSVEEVTLDLELQAKRSRPDKNITHMLMLHSLFKVRSVTLAIEDAITAGLHRK